MMGKGWRAPKILYAFSLCSDNLKMLWLILVIQKQLKGFLDGLDLGFLENWGMLAWGLFSFDPPNLQFLFYFSKPLHFQPRCIA